MPARKGSTSAADMRSLAARLLSSAVASASRSAGGRTCARAAATHASQVSRAASALFAESGGRSAWSPSLLLLPAAAAAYAFTAPAHAAELERTFIAIKPDGVQRGLVAEIVGRFEKKGYKLVAIKVIQPSKEFAEKHYHDLAGRPFFNGLTDFLSSGPVVAMVWEGQGAIEYGRKLIGATSPQKSEPGTIRGDLAVIVGRNIIHGSDGPETAKDEIALWFKPEDLVTYKLDSEKWVYE